MACEFAEEGFLLRLVELVKHAHVVAVAQSAFGLISAIENLLDFGVVLAVLVGVKQGEELVEVRRADADFGQNVLPLGAVSQDELL